MGNRVRILTVTSMALLLLLSGCVNERNYLKRVPRFRSERTIKQTQNNVTLELHSLSIQESEKYFGRNLIADGYFPFHLHIVNHSNQAYLIEPSYITINLSSPHHIAELLHYDTYTHMSYSNLFALLFAWELIPFVIAPTGYSMYKMNQKITRNIRKNSLGKRDREKVPPFGTLDKFFYVHQSDFETRFVIKLCEKTSEHKLLRFLINLDEI